MTKDAIGRIFDKPPSSEKSRFCGTAFAIANSIGLTAFHCIGDRLTGRVVLSRAFVIFPSSDPVEFQYEDGDPKADFAVLKFLTPVSPDLRHIPLIDKTFRQEQFYSPGYPNDIDETDFFTISGTVTEPDASIKPNIPAIQLYCQQSAANLSLHGMSGAPVLIGNRQAAVGIVRWNPENSDGAIGGSLFACPTQLLLNRRPELCAYVKTRTPDEVLRDACQLTQTAVSDIVRDILRSELTRINREKVLSTENRYANLGMEWIPIPSLSYFVPKDVNVKEFLKIFFRVLAMGMQETFVPPMREIQFVSLCHLSIQGTELELTFSTPFEELVAYARQHLPGRIANTELKRLIETSPVEIQHQYGLPYDRLVPLVAVYKPVLQTLLLINKNHLTDPDQFLNPRYCRTTSGFLNFVGALELRNFKDSLAGQSPAFLFEQIEDIVGDKELDQWFRWFYDVLDHGRWETKRIFINSKNPEKYYYQYDPSSAENTSLSVPLPRPAALIQGELRASRLRSWLEYLVSSLFGERS